MFSSKSPKPTDNKTDVKPPVKKAGGIPSIISADMSILGNIISDGLADIDGHIEGNIKCHSATIRKNGYIKGDIVAESVHVYGRIEGLIKARNVQFFKGCRVEGVIMHESITIEDGAYVDGRFKRTDRLALDDADEQSATPNTDKNTPSPAEEGKKTDDSSPRFETLDASEDEEDDEEEEDASSAKEKFRVLDNLRLISDGN